MEQQYIKVLTGGIVEKVKIEELEQYLEENREQVPIVIKEEK